MEKIRLNVNITKEEHRKLKKVAEKYFLNTSDLIRLIAKNAENLILDLKISGEEKSKNLST